MTIQITKLVLGYFYMEALQIQLGIPFSSLTLNVKLTWMNVIIRMNDVIYQWRIVMNESVLSIHIPLLNENRCNAILMYIDRSGALAFVMSYILWPNWKTEIFWQIKRLSSVLFNNILWTTWYRNHFYYLVLHFAQWYQRLKYEISRFDIIDLCDEDKPAVQYVMVHIQKLESQGKIIDQFCLI